MDKRDYILLKKILGEADMIADLISGYDCESFIKDEKTKRAVCMTLVNIGEMVKLLSNHMRADHPMIPWRLITGLRDMTAHGYQTLRMDDIWKTVTIDIPSLQIQIKELLSS